MASKPLTPEVARASLSVRVSSLISVQLARGKVGVEVVASQLHMSRYTLHKKLKREGLTFARLLEDVRRRQALTYMHQAAGGNCRAARVFGVERIQPGFQALDGDIPG